MLYRFVFLIIFAFFGFSAFAQDVAPPDYQQWENIATRAEDAIQAGRASSAALEQLRSQLAVWREGFLSAQNTNRARIETLQNQIASLGPAPEEGQTEAAEIASRRTALREQLTRLRAPIVTAEEAYSRANGLIGEIDRIVRDRQADALLRAGPSPVNPSHWDDALDAVQTTSVRIKDEVRNAWLSPAQRTELRQGLPVAIIFLIFALILILRGRIWMERLATKLSGRGQGVWSFLISIGQIIIPMIGIIAITRAVYQSGLVGLRGDILLSVIPFMGLSFFAARWLGMRAFPRSDAQYSLLTLDERQRRQARFNMASLGFLLGFVALIDAYKGYERYSAEVITVLQFPLIVLSCVILYRIANLIKAHLNADIQENTEKNYRNGLLSILSKVIYGISFAGPIIAAFGYNIAAEFIVFPTVLTLGLIILVSVLQRQVSNVYALLTRRGEDSKDALIPVLISFVLAVAAMPLLVLIWGGRVSDLTEMWTQFREGFAIGETRISPTDFLTVAIVFALGFMLTRLIQAGLRNSVLPKTRVDVGGRNAIVSGTGYIGVFLAAIAAITAAGINLTSLAFVAGALSVGIGFGLQNIVSNFVSGIILLIERPISEGDWIEVGGRMGYVRTISVRSTRIETFDRTDVIVPNADLISNQVINWTRGNSIGRAIVPVGVAYGTDTKKVEAILSEIAKDHPMVVLNPPPNVLFMGFGADSLDFEIRAILRDVNWLLSVKSEMNHAIAKRFAEEGIEIPFAQRDVWLRNPEALKANKDCE
ncbi:DUF3772 domain-containing protein [Parasulfitobacter algicola]|nr:DUF3772 domain-containing protein [Sulfitobacter algicola]